MRSNRRGKGRAFKIQNCPGNFVFWTRDPSTEPSLPSCPCAARHEPEPTTNATSSYEPRSYATTSGQTVTVAYATANGSAIAGSDYDSTSGSLTFLPGETQKQITVLVKSDALTESTETFA